MAKSYTALQQQHNKVNSAIERITPPKPDDEYEDMRREILKATARMDEYLEGRVTGAGSMSTPEIAE